MGSEVFKAKHGPVFAMTRLLSFKTSQGTFSFPEKGNPSCKRKPTFAQCSLTGLFWSWKFPEITEI